MFNRLLSPSLYLSVVFAAELKENKGEKKVSLIRKALQSSLKFCRDVINSRLICQMEYVGFMGFYFTYPSGKEPMGNGLRAGQSDFWTAS